MSDHVVMMTTTPDAESARSLARTLVTERLAACVQVLAAQSFYIWNDAARAEPEALLLIKTRAALQEAAAARIADLHSYETPEIVTLPITFGASPYLAWIDAQTKDAP
jgi:periplasmic divalent cation tolerance protein